MNDAAKLWVDELRSGNFQQARNRLRDLVFADDDAEEGREGYCCLAVACVLYERETGDGHWDLNGNFVVISTGEAAEVELPNAVREWLGLTDKSGWYGKAATNLDARVESPRGCLAIKNDAGATFAEIADIIESEPEGLFVS